MISSNVIADSFSAATVTHQYSQNDFAQILKHNITFSVKVKGCLDELKPQAFQTCSGRLCGHLGEINVSYGTRGVKNTVCQLAGKMRKFVPDAPVRTND